MSIVYLGKATPASGQGGGGSGDAVWGSITGTLSDQTDLAAALAEKQDTLTAGTGIDITNDVISATVSYDNSTINENASNELQAIGVVDKNTSHDSSSLHYMPLWEGTQQQYDTGAQTTFYDWTYSGFGFDTVQLPDDFYGIYGCYGNGKYLVVDTENNTVAYSSDAETWNTFPANTLPHLMESIAYGAGKFVAVGSEGSAYSVDDGENWTTIPDLYSNNIYYGEVNNASAFFMFDGSLNTSSDGINWSEVEGFNYATLFPDSDEIVDICFGLNAIWMLTSTGKVAYSSDLTNWTVETIENNSNNWSEIACSASNVCAIRQDGRTALRFMDQWSITNTETISSGAFETLVWNSNSYVAISTNGIIRQSDATGNNWSVIGNISNDGDWYDGFYGNGKIVVGGFGIAYGGNSIQHIYTITNEPDVGDSTYSEPNGNSKNVHTKDVHGYDSEENTIQLRDGTVCDRNQAGDTLGTISVGEAHPEYLCFIDNNVVKRGNTEVANRTLVMQEYNAYSPFAQSGVAIAGVLGDIETLLSQI